MSDVLTELDDHGVLLLTLHRPERANAWTHDMEDEYFGHLLAAARDPEVRVVVVTGAGTAFCPGLDMEVLARLAAEGKAVRPRYPMTLAVEVPKPVIAAINGACAGVGFVQACASDLRFAAAGAKLSSAFVRRGLPAEHGVAWLLSRLVGTGAATDLLLSGRVVVAEEAARQGLVNRVYPPDELLPATLDYARDLAANCSPWAMATIKAQLLRGWEVDRERARLEALDLMRTAREGADLREGVASFKERRPPTFAGISAVLDPPRVVPP